MSEWKPVAETVLGSRIEEMRQKTEEAQKEMVAALNKDVQALVSIVKVDAKRRGIEIPKEVEERLGSMGL
jgi:hypothetical protein